jgi:hypothetical protein
MMNSRSESAHQYLKTNINAIYILSLVIAVLMAVSSIIGLIGKGLIYPTDDLLQTFLPNDVVNLIIGVPILLLSMWLTKKGKLIGLLLWPGALFYVTYNYIAYAFGLPFNLVFLPNLILVTLSAYTLILLLAGIQSEGIQAQLSGKVSEKITGFIIFGFGLVYVIRVLVMAVGANINKITIPEIELAPMIADFIVCPAWIIGGLLLWRKKAFGYVSGLGLLFQSSMLFIALIIYMLIQPTLTGAEFSVIDLIVVALMGLVCFIPLGLFARGVVRKPNS